MNKKNMNFPQLLNKSNISLFGDADEDKVPNVFDCKPLDPDQDGLFGRAVNVLSLGKFGQSKEEYEAEKISKIHFERDPASGKVIRVTENGQEIDPSAKTVDQLLREHQMEKYKSALQRQKAANALIKQQIELRKLKLKQQELKLTQSIQAKQTRGSAAKAAINMMMGISGQNIPQKPGYFIEPTGPKLPKGFKWKKIPKDTKSSRPGPNVPVCPTCNIPLMMMPGFLGQPTLGCPRCGSQDMMNIY